MRRHSRAGFRNPTSEFRFAPFWFLNHELSAEETVWQLREMHRQGVEGAILHPRHGLITPYLSPEWMDQLEVAIQEADRLGMKLYLYDENNWPSGPADGLAFEGHPEYRMSGVRLEEEFSVRGGEKVERALPVGDELVAVVAAPTGDERAPFPEACLDLRAQVHNGRLEWDAPKGNWKVYVLCRQYMAGTFFGSYLDTLNPEAVARFIALTHQKYYERFGHHFGGTVVGIFTDEPSMNYNAEDAIPWTSALPQEFEWRHGYRLATALPALFRNMGAATARVRSHFYDTVTDLYAKAFFKQIYDFCDERRLASVGHVVCEGEVMESVRHQGDFFRGAEYMHFGGVDMLCEITWPERGYGLNNLIGGKLASSAAHLFGKPATMSECFGLASAWGISLRTLKWLADWEIAMGINLLMPHAFYYSIQGFRKWECPPGEFYQSPFWPYYRQFADYAARLCYLFRGGRHLADAVVLWPARSFWAALEPGPSDAARKLADSLNTCTSALLKAGCDFDFINEELLARADLSQGMVRVRDEKGELREEYPLLVLPALSALSEEGAHAIVRYLRAGGRLLLTGDVPWRTEESGVAGREAMALRLAISDCQDRIASTTVDPGDPEEVIVEDYARAIRSLIDPQVTIETEDGPPGDIIYLHHQRGDDRLLFLTNTSREHAHKARVALHLAGIPEYWDPITGEPRPFYTYEPVADTLVLDITFAPTESHLIVVHCHRAAEGHLAVEADGVEVESVTPREVTVTASVPGPVSVTLHAEGTTRRLAGKVTGKMPEPLTLSGPWDFSLLRPNALPLQKWDYEMQAAVTGRDSNRFGHHYRCRFDVDRLPGQARLLLDGLALEKVWRRSAPLHFEVTLNGKPVKDFQTGEYLDHFIPEADITALLVKGTNELAVRCDSHLYEPGNLAHPAILVGDFSVKEEGGRPHLAAPVKQLAPGRSWISAGYPYYSGTACYRREVRVLPSWLKGPVWLVLEKVADLADIWVNGKQVATLLWEPFRVDLAPHLNAGVNQLEIRVANSLQNLLCMVPKDSGLLGTVRLVPHRRVVLR